MTLNGKIVSSLMAAYMASVFKSNLWAYPDISLPHFKSYAYFVLTGGGYKPAVVIWEDFPLIRYWDMSLNKNKDCFAAVPQCPCLSSSSSSSPSPSPFPPLAQLLMPCHHGTATTFNIKTNMSVQQLQTDCNSGEVQQNLGSDVVCSTNDLRLRLDG